MIATIGGLCRPVDPLERSLSHRIAHEVVEMIFMRRVLILQYSRILFIAC